MSALNRKMMRDLLRMKGQVIAISLVMACGVSTFVLSLSTLHSLQRTLDTYYERYRFAEVFAHLKRAPDALMARIAEIPGVAQVQTRVVESVTLDMPGLAEPAVGRLISVVENGAGRLNDLYLREGRRLEAGSRREVLVGEAFALAHGLEPGDTVTAIINGRLDHLTIVGIVLSPEYIYQIRDGELLPDDLRFGVFWINEQELASAFDMDGAFNDVALTLMPGATEADVIAHLDRLTEVYGGLGAYGRDDQTSHKFVANEINELRGMVYTVPVIFLAVAAFLLNIVVTRLISTQREQIASLKALGYTRLEVGGHYLKLVLLVVLVGVAFGSAIGAWMGAWMTRMYTLFFHFPIFEYHLRPSVLVLAFLVGTVVALVGTAGAIRCAMRLPPAEAMRPLPPADFRPTVLERIGLERVLSPAARMILRQLERRPAKAALSCLTISLAVGVLVVGEYTEDAIDYALAYEFEDVQRYDLTVSFVEPATPTALAAIRHLPGVERCEPFRAVASRLKAGHRSRRLGVMGVVPDGELFHLTGVMDKAVRLPPSGLVVSEKLAELLAVSVGDVVTMEVLQEWRPVRRLPVVGLVDDVSGTAAYMDVRALNRLMRESDVMSGAFIAADPLQIDRLYTELKNTPRVAGVTIKEAALESFLETMVEMMLKMKAINVMFAVVIAFGVVYNSARISLSERSRELATLRVVGFTRAEISLIQLGEMALLTAVAIPLGLLVGYGLAVLTSAAFNTELFRVPLVIDRSTYAFAATVVIVATIASALVVRRMLDRLDLVAVLKARE